MSSFEINNKSYTCDGANMQVDYSEYMNKNSNKSELNTLTRLITGLDKDPDKKDNLFRKVNGLIKSANGGNMRAIVELNATKTIVIEQAISTRLDLLKDLTFANRIPMENEHLDIVNFEYNYKTGKGVAIQDRNASFPFATFNKGRASLKLQNVTGGATTNYYQMADVATNFSKQMNAVIDDMFNQIETYIFTGSFSMIKESKSPLKMFNVGIGGLSKLAVDEYINNCIRVTNKNPIIYATNTMAKQIKGWVGYTDKSGGIHISDDLINEINKTGFVGFYDGCAIMRINEGIDEDTIMNTISGGQWYAPNVSQGILYITPTSINESEAIQYAIGKLNTMTATDINTATFAQRWDLLFGSTLIPTAIPYIGVCSDDRYPMQ